MKKFAIKNYIGGHNQRVQAGLVDDNDFLLSARGERFVQSFIFFVYMIPDCLMRICVCQRFCYILTNKPGLTVNLHYTDGAEFCIGCACGGKMRYSAPRNHRKFRGLERNKIDISSIATEAQKKIKKFDKKL